MKKLTLTDAAMRAKTKPGTLPAFQENFLVNQELIKAGFDLNKPIKWMYDTSKQANVFKQSSR